MKRLLSKFQDVDIKTDPYTGASRGFGFILFEEASSVEKVVVGGPHNLDGKRIDPKNASKNSKIFVGGLKNETTDEDVRKYFEDNFGAIETFERLAASIFSTKLYVHYFS